jgi:hypothetical protein
VPLDVSQSLFGHAENALRAFITETIGFGICIEYHLDGGARFVQSVVRYLFGAPVTRAPRRDRVPKVCAAA